MVRLVYRTFNEKSRGEEYNFFKFFIDPRSFSQSVENLFFTSFLIRDGKVKLTKNKDGIPMIKICSVREAEEASTSSKNKTHHIATFDYQTWEGLIRTFDITECFLGHRDIEADEIPSDDEANFEQSDEDEELHNGSSQILERGVMTTRVTPKAFDYFIFTRSSDFTFKFSNISIPAVPIITALSVHNAMSGK
ncbi:hypothetical protein QCA50_016021 [Cerrena zonata]|uniref:Non-structural maintenance of chromosomes element 4 n=1 Tax=Cerrena zonata TaxID=2478898 RepID=A0AAW0FIT7_9APHY